MIIILYQIPTSNFLLSGFVFKLMILQRQFTIVLFCLFLQFVQAQDTIFIFTKHDCSVCKQTKQVLTSRGVTFLEKEVETAVNASEMLSKLAFSGFKGSIYMPVIYSGKKLLHPAYSTDSGLVSVDINVVADTLVRRYRRGEIAKINMPVTALEAKPQVGNTTECEHTTGTVYLVAANYPVEKEALGAVQILLKNGYPNAGFLLANNIFRVYLASYPDFSTASSQLTIEKFKFTDAYLFEIK